MKELGYFRRWFLIIFALFCFGMNIIAYVFYEKNQQISDTKQWVSHTYEVMNQAYRVYTDIQDMQTSQRGYLLTGVESFLDPFERSNEDLNEAMDKLIELTNDNAERQGDVAQYKQAIIDFRAVLEKHLATWRETHSIDSVDFTESKNAMDRVRALHTKIIASEGRLLEERQMEEQHQRKSYVATLFATAEFSAIGLFLANGLVGFLTYRRKYAEDDLRRINKEMEGFTYIASHDLRSPLVNLKGFATEMKYSIEALRPIIKDNKTAFSEDDGKKLDLILDDEIPDALRYIHSSVEKMDKLTNAILELSRIGRRDMEFKRIEPERIVRHILDTLHHTIAAKNVGVSVLPLPSIIADQLSLEQVFSNIIDNAIKYMDPERRGFIEIGGLRMHRATKYWVKDNGRGIHMGDQQKVFEIYRRAGNIENIPGEGMGMAYVRATLRRLGGQIWCESTPGQGTTFYFTISNSLKKGENE